MAIELLSTRTYVLFIYCDVRACLDQLGCTSIILTRQPTLFPIKTYVFVIFAGNSANQAIDLLIQKGVPESHIIFLNLISVSSFTLSKLVDHSNYQILMSIYSLRWSSGPGGNSLCLQTIPVLENCHFRDRRWIERRVSCRTRYG